MSIGTSDGDPSVVEITTTYLQLMTPAEFRPVFIDHPDAQVIEVQEPWPAFYRFLYHVVGHTYYWTERTYWSDDHLAEYLARPTVTLLVLYVRGAPAGYIDLCTESDEPGTEVAYFGLVPRFHGRGLGKHLLSVGVQQAFDAGASRVWLHTCTLDGPHALANYKARGFQPYRTITSEWRRPAQS